MTLQHTQHTSFVFHLHTCPWAPGLCILGLRTQPGTQIILSVVGFDKTSTPEAPTKDIQVSGYRRCYIHVFMAGTGNPRLTATSYFDNTKKLLNKEPIDLAVL
ncbi:hypothetical protein ABW21_db0204721 [Orbilia brochopaga]|nr:hypothetical protein ABW21_db0204721 [Drechslerella brochopaga]